MGILRKRGNLLPGQFARRRVFILMPLYSSKNYLRDPSRANSSVVRRSFKLLMVTLPSALMNLALAYVASLILEKEAFGVFYTAISIVNVAFAPAVALSMYYSRYFVRLSERKNEASALQAYRLFVRDIWLWGGAAALVVALFGITFGRQISSYAPWIIVEIAAILMTSYLAESRRIYFQSQRQFSALGWFSLTWLGLRFVLGAAGVAVFQTAIGGLVGVAVAGLIAFYLFRIGAPEQERDGPGAYVADLGERPTLLKLLPLGLSYSAFMLIVYADVLLAYLVLDQGATGQYAGASIFPKAVVLATLPLVWVLFPFLVTDMSKSVLFRGFVATLLVSAAAAVVIYFGAGPLCGSWGGLNICNPELTRTQALGVVPLCLIRLGLVRAFAGDDDWRPTWLLVPALMFSIFVFSTQPTSAELAWATVIFYLLTLAGEVGAVFLFRIRPRREQNH